MILSTEESDVLYTRVLLLLCEPCPLLTSGTSSSDLRIAQSTTSGAVGWEQMLVATVTIKCEPKDQSTRANPSILEPYLQDLARYGGQEYVLRHPSRTT